MENSSNSLDNPGIYIVLGCALTLLFVTLLIFLVWIFGQRDLVVPPYLGGRDTLKTGDLLITGYPGAYKFITQIFTGSRWNHVSLVYRNSEGSIFIIEMANHSRETRGALMLPFDTWLQYTRDCPKLIRSYHGPPIGDQQVLTAYQKYQHCRLKHFDFTWIQYLGSSAPYRPESIRARYICSEYIVMMLQEMGVLTKIYTPSSYTPKSVAYDSLPTESGTFDSPRMYFS